MQKQPTTTPMLMMQPLGTDDGGLHCARTGFLTLPPGFFDAWVKETAARAGDAANKSIVQPVLRAREHIPGFPEAAHALHMLAARHDQAHNTAGNPQAGLYAHALHFFGSMYGPNPGYQLPAPPQLREYV